VSPSTPGAESRHETEPTYIEPLLAMELRKIPGLYRYRLDGDRLIPVGRTVPTARLPKLTWTGIEKFFRIELPRTRLPAAAPPPTPIRIVRSTRERPSTALLVDFATFRLWAECAPTARLLGLSFALSLDGRSFVRGTKLPPLRGDPFWVECCLAVPCGFAWEPRVSASVVRAVMRRNAPAGEGLFLFDSDGAWEFIAELSFVNANRASVRATDELRDATLGSEEGA
jgi:hypothetical protein